MSAALRDPVNEQIVTGLVVLVTLGGISELLSNYLKIPSILVLLVVGFVAGPVTGWLDPEELLGDVTFPLVSLGAALILFEGGLTARVQDISDVRRPVLRLITVGLLVTWSSVTALAHLLLGLSLSLSFLLGAILVVTGPTVIGPLLAHARPKGNVGRILKYEGILNDPLGALLAVIVFQVIEVELVETAFSLVVFSVLKAALLATAVGFAASVLFVQARRRGWLPERLSNAILLPLVLCAFSVANHVQSESGLLSVTVMGIALASQKHIDIEPNIDFAEHLRVMLIPVLFILLTARMRWSDLRNIPVEAFAFVGLMILFVRPLAVYFSTIGARLETSERIFLSSMAPRGIVAAAVSSVFSLRLVEQGEEGALILMPTTFLVIAVCVVVYGLGASPILKVTGLSQQSPRGVLFLGAHRAARSLAEGLQKAGVPVVLVDSNRANVMQSRSLGLTAEHGRLLSEHVQNRLDLGSIGMLVALTSSEDANTLAVTHFRRTFGPEHVHQLAPNRDTRARRNRDAPHVQGGTFSPRADFTQLAYYAREGGTKLTPLTEEFSYDDFLAHYGQSALPLFAINEKGVARVLSDEGPQPKAGEQILSFLLNSPESTRKGVTEKTPLVAQ